MKGSYPSKAEAYPGLGVERKGERREGREGKGREGKGGRGEALWSDVNVLKLLLLVVLSHWGRKGGIRDVATPRQGWRNSSARGITI